MKPAQDAFGQGVYDHYRGEPVTEIIERDDGYLGISGGAAAMAPQTASRLSELFAAIGAAVAGSGSMVIDGGTRAGVMQLMGEALAQTDRLEPILSLEPVRNEPNTR